MPPLLNVFNPILTRHADHEGHLYVEHPTEGWRVYLRGASFLHIATYSPDTFVIVKTTGKNTWDLPKGRTKAHEVGQKKNITILEHLMDGAMREIYEESHIKDVRGLRHTGLVFQSQEADYKPNWYFQYHVFQGMITPAVYTEAERKFEWLRAHPKAFARMATDRKEKDGIALFTPGNLEKRTPIIKRWTPTIIYMYLKGRM